MSKKKLIPVLIIIVLIIVGIVIFLNIPKNDKLVGLWDSDGNTKYEFDGKGKGKILVPMAEYIFAYSIKGNTVSIDFVNEKATDTVYEFKVSGDKLELRNKSKTDSLLKLKKVKK